MGSWDHLYLYCYIRLGSLDSENFVALGFALIVGAAVYSVRFCIDDLRPKEHTLVNIILLSEENLHIVNVLQIAQECGSRLRHENGRKSPRRHWLIETLGTLEKHHHFVVPRVVTFKCTKIQIFLFVLTNKIIYCSLDFLSISLHHVPTSFENLQG